ncbi:predicted protein, partial [Nematostella vectensis]
MAFIVFVLACLIWPVNAKIPLYVGGFFPLSPNKASVPGHALLAAAKLALSHVNNSDILPNHDLRMIIKNSKAGQSNNQVIEELKKLNCSVVLSQQISDNQLDLDLQTLTRNDARIIVGTFYERKARQIFCQ